jgi:hypothetical protein
MKRNKDLKTSSVNRHTFVINNRRIWAQELNHITCTLNASKRHQVYGKKKLSDRKNDIIKMLAFTFSLLA